MLEDIDEFLEWYVALNPQDVLDMSEAMEIYFNQETYEVAL